MLNIEKDTTVRQLLAAHPGVFHVLLGRGMCADCQADPPAVPLQHFAAKHCAGDIDALLADLRGAVANGAHGGA